METLIILGNGFDLDLGWKTSYKDFFQAKQNKFYQLSGLSYIQNMIEDECWYNLEGYLRQCIVQVKPNDIKNLNTFWLICSNFMLDYFTHNTSKFKTNFQSCAYHFMKSIRNSVVYTFNYTNPFKEVGIEEPEIHFIHGKLNGALSGSLLKLT